MLPIMRLSMSASSAQEIRLEQSVEDMIGPDWQ